MSLILDAQAISTIFDQMAAWIAQDHPQSGEGAVLVGIRRRGVPMAERLARRLEAPWGTLPDVGVLDINFYRDDLSHVAEQPVVGVTEIPFEVEGADIYLIDDVLYTGRTIRSALEAIMAFGRPQRIRLLCLIDRGYRELPIQADFIGQQVETKLGDIVEVQLEEIDGTDQVVLQIGEGS